MKSIGANEIFTIVPWFACHGQGQSSRYKHLRALHAAGGGSIAWKTAALLQGLRGGKASEGHGSEIRNQQGCHYTPTGQHSAVLHHMPPGWSIWSHLHLE